MYQSVAAGNYGQALNQHLAFELGNISNSFVSALPTNQGLAPASQLLGYYLNPDSAHLGHESAPFTDFLITSAVGGYDVFAVRNAVRVASLADDLVPSNVNYEPNFVAGPNPNALQQRVVISPTAGEGGVYLKSQAGKTKVGSTGDFRGRYGPNGGIEVEIPQTRTAPLSGVDDSAYPCTRERQLRFDEEYIDRLTPRDVRYRAPTKPQPPVSQQKWDSYRHIFGYGDVPSDFGY